MKQNSSYSFISRFVILFILVVFVGWVCWLWWNDSISPLDANDTTPVTFSIDSGDGVKAIAADLATRRLIRSPTGFYLLVKFLGIERQLQAGEYRLNPSMDARTIALELTHGISDQWITILEGWRDEEVAAKISKDFGIPEQEFLKVARQGYMFPDTYLIPQDATIAAIVTMFTDNFDKKISVTLRNQAARIGLSFDQVMVLASIVEREGNSAADRPEIASVLYKRLQQDWPLQADATLQYALGYQSQEKSWWKKSLTEADKKIDSPYNTYMHTGLPPGPICNPGLESIQAVLAVHDTPYWYYLHDPSGTVHYAGTIDEHESNIEQYLR